MIAVVNTLSTKGRLLIASPALDDGVFDRTVVYVLEHTPEGALGVVLNRPSSEIDVPGLGAWKTLLAPPAFVFAGGPVEEQALIGLAATDSGRPGEGWAPIAGGIGSVDLGTEPNEVAPVIDRARIFRGYAGWAASQLDGELAIDAWIVVDAVAEDVFSSDPDHLWRTVLSRQPGRLSWLAHYPDDVELN